MRPLIDAIIENPKHVLYGLIFAPAFYGIMISACYLAPMLGKH